MLVEPPKGLTDRIDWGLSRKPELLLDVPKPRIGTDVEELWIVLAKRARCRVVLARAFADEPVRLRAVRVADGVVEVAGEDAALSIGWPPAFAYRFDAALFGRLRAAYDRGDQATLTRLWGKAQRAKLGAGE